MGLKKILGGKMINYNIGTDPIPPEGHIAIPLHPEWESKLTSSFLSNSDNLQVSELTNNIKDTIAAGIAAKIKSGRISALEDWNKNPQQGIIEKRRF